MASGFQLSAAFKLLDQYVEADNLNIFTDSTRKSFMSEKVNFLLNAVNFCFPMLAVVGHIHRRQCCPKRDQVRFGLHPSKTVLYRQARLSPATLPLLVVPLTPIAQFFFVAP